MLREVGLINLSFKTRMGNLTSSGRITDRSCSLSDR